MEESKILKGPTANWTQFKSFSNRVKDSLNKANWKYVVLVLGEAAILI